VAKANIDPLFVEKISEKDSKLEIGQLVEERNQHLSQIDKLRSQSKN
jgi:hypothetical protein